MSVPQLPSEPPAKFAVIVFGFESRTQGANRFSPWVCNTIIDENFGNRNLFVPDVIKKGLSFIWMRDGQSLKHRERAIDMVRLHDPEYVVVAVFPVKPERFLRWRQKPHSDENYDYGILIPEDPSASHYVLYRHGLVGVTKGFMW